MTDLRDLDGLAAETLRRAEALELHVRRLRRLIKVNCALVAINAFAIGVNLYNFMHLRRLLDLLR